MQQQVIDAQIKQMLEGISGGDSSASASKSPSTGDAWRRLRQ